MKIEISKFYHLLNFLLFENSKIKLCFVDRRLRFHTEVSWFESSIMIFSSEISASGSKNPRATSTNELVVLLEENGYNPLINVRLDKFCRENYFDLSYYYYILNVLSVFLVLGNVCW